MELIAGQLADTCKIIFVHKRLGLIIVVRRSNGLKCAVESHRALVVDD